VGYYQSVGILIMNSQGVTFSRDNKNGKEKINDQGMLHHKESGQVKILFYQSVYREKDLCNLGGGEKHRKNMQGLSQETLFQKTQEDGLPKEPAENKVFQGGSSQPGRFSHLVRPGDS
jgi:hypothetical protein